MADEPKKLSAKQQRFVEEYCTDFNATQAAIRAGYSLSTARSIGSENLTKPDIKKAITGRLSSLSMSLDEATKRMSEYARGTFRPFLLISPNNDFVVDLTTEEARDNIGLIKKLKQTKRMLGESMVDITTEIEIHDSKDAVKSILMLHGKLIEKNVNIKGKIEDLNEAQLNKLIDNILQQQQNNE